MRAYLFRMGGDLALADDALQEAYMRYLAMAPDRRAAFPERPLLFRIAINVMRDHFRRARRDEQATRALPPPGRPGSWAAPDDDVARALGELRERERALLWLAYVEGWRHDEMADAFRVRPASVRVLLSRARAALARILRRKGLGPEEES